MLLKLVTIISISIISIISISISISIRECISLVVEEGEREREEKCMRFVIKEVEKEVMVELTKEGRSSKR